MEKADERSHLLNQESNIRVSVSAFRRRSLMWASALVLFLLAVIVIMTPRRDSYSFPITHFENGAKIQLKSLDVGLYMRVNNFTGHVVLDQKVPWLKGSTFEIETSGECFRAKSLLGKWLSVDSEGHLRAIATNAWDASYFTAVTSTKEQETMQIPVIHLKLCEQNAWIRPMKKKDLHAGIDSHLLFTHKVSVLDRVVSLTEYYSASIFGTERDSKPLPEVLLHKANVSTYEVVTVEPIHGVNLGGWFIPEGWMNPGIFKGFNLGWQNSLCKMVNRSRTLAEERMAHQLETWVTEQDFKEISELGFNSVRLPVGYWNIIKDPYNMYAPADNTKSLRYIDFAFDMADKYGLTVLLDLHGAPGSQNGIDHSGCGMHPYWTLAKNVELTLQTIEAMAQRYAHRPNLLGFELLNEPAQWFSEANHTLLHNFYETSYHIIRKYHPTTLIVFNELYAHCYSWWNQAITEPVYYNVMVDWHLYSWVDQTGGPQSHIDRAKNWANTIDEFTPAHPVLIGEWCMSTGPRFQVGQPFVDACVESFKHAMGWYMWNWKIERGAGFDEWDVQFQHKLGAAGLDPRKKW